MRRVGARDHGVARRREEPASSYGLGLKLRLMKSMLLVMYVD